MCSTNPERIPGGDNGCTGMYPDLDDNLPTNACLFHTNNKWIQVDFAEDSRTYEKQLEDQLRGLDIGILINNVGMTYSSPEYFHIVTASTDFIHKMVNLNVIAATIMTRAILPGMLEKEKVTVLIV
jgi:17beta-estradiol 17-dehydrogenase / very-long-chain 3-oxoacyl-CoA reductase